MNNFDAFALLGMIITLSVIVLYLHFQVITLVNKIDRLEKIIDKILKK